MVGANCTMTWRPSLKVSAVSGREKERGVCKLISGRTCPPKAAIDGSADAQSVQDWLRVAQIRQYNHNSKVSRSIRPYFAGPAAPLRAMIWPVNPHGWHNRAPRRSNPCGNQVRTILTVLLERASKAAKP